MFQTNSREVEAFGSTRGRSLQWFQTNSREVEARDTGRTLSRRLRFQTNSREVEALPDSRVLLSQSVSDELS